MGASTTYYHQYQTPLGPLTLAGTDSELKYVGFPAGSRRARINENWQPDKSKFKDVARQLTLYFDGKLKVFDLPLSPVGTGFQQKVWQQLQQIPYGETVSYGDIAKAIQQPGASRAVGSANGSNPIPIIIPCHRVIGANGSLTGFGGGLPTKRFLLQLENADQLSLPF